MSVPSHPSEQADSRLLDLGNNGLVVHREGGCVSIELVDHGELQADARVVCMDNQAEAEFARMITKLICAGVTASIPPSTIGMIVERVLHELREFGVQVNLAATECRAFKYDMEPTIEYAYSDKVMNGIVVGNFGLFAELQPLPNP